MTCPESYGAETRAQFSWEIIFSVERRLAQARVLNGGFHGRFFGLILLLPAW